MTISCAIDVDDAAWWWTSSMRLFIYDKPRGKRCCSCGDMVRRGEKHIRVERWRAPANDVEDRIYGDEVPLACWVMCESCAPIFVKLYKMNVEMDLGHSNLHDLLGEFEALYGPNKEFKLKLPNYKEGVWA